MPRLWTLPMLEYLNQFRLAHPALSHSACASAVIDDLKRQFPEAGTLTHSSVASKLSSLLYNKTILTPKEHAAALREQYSKLDLPGNAHGQSVGEMEWTDDLLCELVETVGHVYQGKLEPRNDAIAKRFFERTGKQVDGKKLYRTFGILCPVSKPSGENVTLTRRAAVLKSKGLPTRRSAFEKRYNPDATQVKDEHAGGGGSGPGAGSKKRSRDGQVVKREESVEDGAGGEEPGGRGKCRKVRVKREEE
ncbi:hypothetical protein JCM8208_002011 [Rhodotorula glutinis]